MDENKKKLYVGNLPYKVASEDLKTAFSAYGEVADAVVISDKRFGRSQGFGFVEFVDEAAAQKAVEAMNGSEMEGRKLVVNFARPPCEDAMPAQAGAEVMPEAKEEEEVVEEE